MLFSSFTFLFLFFPTVLLGYWLVSKANKISYSNSFLLFVSYIFYAWGAPKVIPILIFMSIFDFYIANKIDSLRQEKFIIRKTLLTLGISVNLLILFYYKYWNFFLSEIHSLFLHFGFSSFVWQKVVLPIGISFFTFQKISYIVDVYRKTAKPANNIIDYCLYVALFPQLIAGPIVRYHEIAQQLRKRAVHFSDLSQGLTRFCFGLSKKVLIADYLAQVADKAFALPQGELITSIAWLGIIAYTFQIYFDFSGYSDMAIGIGRIFGFTFPENFNSPYISQSITEFWSRWHMTLSHWMREYLYIPLGGNRVSKARNIINLWIVFLLSGLWHGASWNFLAWGGFHGFWLTYEKLFNKDAPQAEQSIFKTAKTFILVIFSWVLFRTENFSQTIEYWKVLIGLENGKLEKLLFWADIIQPREIAMLFVAAFLCSFPIFSKSTKIFTSTFYSKDSKSLTIATGYLFFLLSLCSLAALDYTPFLYFRF